MAGLCTFASRDRCVPPSLRQDRRVPRLNRCPHAVRRHRRRPGRAAVCATRRRHPPGAGVLRREGQPGPAGARTIGASRFRVRRGQPGRDRPLPRSWRCTSRHLVRQHHQEAARHRLRRVMWRHPLHGGRGCGTREGGCRGTGRVGVRAAAPRLRRCRLATVAQIRCRGPRCGACAHARSRRRHGVGRVVPRGVATARPRRVGRHVAGGGRSVREGARPRRRPALHQPRWRFPGHLPRARTGGERIRRCRARRLGALVPRRPRRGDGRAWPLPGGRRRCAAQRSGAGVASLA